MSKKHILDKAYDPAPVEQKWSDFWIQEGLTRAGQRKELPVRHIRYELLEDLEGISAEFSILNMKLALFSVSVSQAESAAKVAAIVSANLYLVWEAF